MKRAYKICGLIGIMYGSAAFAGGVPVMDPVPVSAPVPMISNAPALKVAEYSVVPEMPAEGKSKCAACHGVDKKKVGPAWTDVSEKYKDNKDAESVLVKNITEGGSYDWKMGKMPARGLGASDADIKKLAKFIADLKKKK